MSTYRENRVSARFAALAPEPMQGDWLDVQRRVGNGDRRRMAMLAVAAALAVLVIGSALGARRGLDYFSAPTAPDRVVAQFQDARRVQRAHWGTDWPAVGDELRTVFRYRFSDGTRGSIALAPTDEGFCSILGDFATGCGEAERSRDTIRLLAPIPHLGEDPGGNTLGMHDFIGAVTDPETARVVLRYEDGKQDDVPFTWVSKPIDAGFFVFDPTPEHYGEGRRAAAFVALDARGRELGSCCDWSGWAVARDAWAFPARRGMPRAMEDASVQRLPTPQLPVWLSAQVGRNDAGGQCVRVSHDLLGVCRKPGSVLNCCSEADSYGQEILGRSRRIRLLYGFMDADARLELSFEDGRRVVVRPREQVILYALPPRAFERGHELLTGVIRKGPSDRVVKKILYNGQLTRPFAPGNAVLESVRVRG